MTKNLNEFFPPIETYNKGFLKVSEIHNLYYEESGNPQGNPVIFLHGGPGGGVNPDHRRFFDPAVYRIILFDQRGSGQSTPCAELRENTTWDLVNDIEKIRNLLKIDKVGCLWWQLGFNACFSLYHYSSRKCKSSYFTRYFSLSSF